MTCDVRLRRIIGLPVMLGIRSLGCVERAVLTPDGKQLRGVVIRRGMGSARWAGEDAIRLMGETALILARKPTRPPPGSDFHLRAVKDEGGMPLGLVTDAWLSPASLRVTALEISLGPADDMLQGRRTIRRWTVGTDAQGVPQVLVPHREWAQPRKEVTG